LKKDWCKCGGIFDLASKEAEVKRLEERMEDPQFWEDPTSAQAIVKECNELKSWTMGFHEISQRFSAIKTLFPEAEKTKDLAFLEELKNELDAVEKKLSDLETRKMLSKEMDRNSCYLSINAGAGGTEACDWAEMLARMYQRYAQKKEWKVEIIDRLDGEVAGIKSITFRLEGSYAYGMCKSEKGVHRLVRISPFDSNARRHTSFASVDVTPIIDEEIVVEMKPEDLRIDTFRASGAGGQHVNRTDSAVRITHLPTGIVVASQSERSQVQNKETCMKMLKSKLYEKQVLEREQSLKELGGEKKEIAWGSQIRNYVFQPYSLVKDTRTKWETGNVAAVMDGEIEDFITAYLKEFG
jgi:peptide chain release factor 2